MENLDSSLTLKDEGITDDSVPDVTQNENAQTQIDSNPTENGEKIEEIEKAEENGQDANTEPEQRDSESDNQDEITTTQNNGMTEVIFRFLS